jgi:hypothetical protein
MIKTLFAMTCCIVGASVSLAQEKPTGDTSSKDAGGIILVVGASGTDEFGEQFQQWAEKWVDVASKSETPLKQIGLGENGKTNDRDQLRATIGSVQPQGAEPLWLVMIGHGTFARGVAKFNLRGPDVAATELAEWLKSVQRPVVIVNCASSSGPFINRLSGNNRIVVTSTKSGNEHNYARFGEYFSQAIASADSDLDHDDEVSVHEAFLRASADVRQFYEAEARIATEHALIDDNGDGKGTPATMFRGVRANAKAKDGAKLDGPIASRVTLAPAGGRLPFTPEELEQRASIETDLDKLRERKGELSQQEYDAKIEPLLLRLARIYQAAEKRD